ncbi:helix-turn-helix domain-containing protein [Alkaliphilus pronyensis]|uniref:Helix-turn-helix domain-containing protein n=1 Tax=Alkaliphilus pronyensis TaxID=1482732 RepID=A0A6I0F8X5_9FIRM|nr:XRE family transcriptional regulator [Alkaliphilus pronyensis]KAB3538535.1 helix-turn-helix domain-containing protein [Alkaliphilus pronyensis]
MENLNSVISMNLKQIRGDMKLSLDKVAEMTGISKSMLGQIERGESNPTITTVWKIANGLKVSFTTLLNQPESDTVIVTKEDIKPMIEDNGRYKLYPFFPYEDGRRFEVYKVEIEKGGYLSAEPHGQETYEFVTVFDGEITIRVEDEEYTVKKGDSIKFRADKPHAYHNSGDDLTRVSMVIYYPE